MPPSFAPGFEPQIEIQNDDSNDSNEEPVQKKRKKSKKDKKERKDREKKHKRHKREKKDEDKHHRKKSSGSCHFSIFLGQFDVNFIHSCYFPFQDKFELPR